MEVFSLSGGEEHLVSFALRLLYLRGVANWRSVRQREPRIEDASTLGNVGMTTTNVLNASPRTPQRQSCPKPGQEGFRAEALTRRPSSPKGRLDLLIVFFTNQFVVFPL